MSSHKLLSDFVISPVVPPFLTGIWLIYVGFNNRKAEHSGGGQRIEPHPWRNLIHGNLVVLFLTALDLFTR